MARKTCEFCGYAEAEEDIGVIQIKPPKLWFRARREDMTYLICNECFEELIARTQHDIEEGLYEKI